MEMLFYVVLYLGGCYYAAAIGAKKKIGFGDTFLLSLWLTPVTGILLAVNSPLKNAPEEYTKTDYKNYKAAEKPAMSENEQQEFSALLKQYSSGKISKQEFEQRTARFS